MNERLIVKSFGPVRDLDITFKKVTLFIGDQGTGKSCVAKLFSMFKWLEKVLSQKKYKLNYFEQYNRFLTNLKVIDMSLSIQMVRLEYVTKMKTSVFLEQTTQMRLASQRLCMFQPNVQS